MNGCHVKTIAFELFKNCVCVCARACVRACVCVAVPCKTGLAIGECLIFGRCGIKSTCGCAECTQINSQWSENYVSTCILHYFQCYNFY